MSSPTEILVDARARLRASNSAGVLVGIPGATPTVLHFISTPSCPPGASKVPWAVLHARAVEWHLMGGTDVVGAYDFCGKGAADVAFAIREDRDAEREDGREEDRRTLVVLEGERRLRGRLLNSGRLMEGRVRKGLVDGLRVLQCSVSVDGVSFDESEGAIGGLCFEFEGKNVLVVAEDDERPAGPWLGGSMSVLSRVGCVKGFLRGGFALRAVVVTDIGLGGVLRVVREDFRRSLGLRRDLFADEEILPARAVVRRRDGFGVAFCDYFFDGEELLGEVAHRVAEILSMDDVEKGEFLFEAIEKLDGGGEGKRGLGGERNSEGVHWAFWGALLAAILAIAMGVMVCCARNSACRYPF